MTRSFLEGAPPPEDPDGDHAKIRAALQELVDQPGLLMRSTPSMLGPVTPDHIVLALVCVMLQSQLFQHGPHLETGVKAIEVRAAGVLRQRGRRGAGTGA